MALDTIEVARKEIAKIYIAAFNRVPDAGGLSNWLNQYTAGLMTYKQIAADFANQPEYTAKYPSIMTDSEYITKIYLNVFGRTPDPGGLQNWINQIANPAVSGITRGSVMQEMLLSAAAPGNSDGVRLANQADFGVQSILDGVPEATATAQLANITADTATVTAATAAVSGSAGSSAGSSFALTAATDTLSGTANNDTFNAAYTSTPAATFSIGDTIDGGAGIDTLKIVKTTAIAQTDVAPTGATVTNVEIAEVISGAQVVANTSTGALTGITTLNVTSTGGATVTAAATTDINLTDASVDTETDGEITVNGGKNVTLTLTADDAASNADGGGANAEIVVGATTAAVGAVSVTHTGKYADGSNNTLSDIAVTGGTTITVTQATGITAAQASSALTDGSNNTVTHGAVSVTGSSVTTAVTVNQDAMKAVTQGAADDADGQIGVTNGAVTIADANAASTTAAGTLTTVTLNNFGASTIDSSALTTVNLSGKGVSLGIGRGGLTATPTANTLTINTNGLTTTGAITDSEAAADDGFTTINIANTTAASTIADFVAADLTTLNVSGDAKLTITTHTAASLTSITVTNTGGLDMDGTAIGNATTFTGGAGADAVSLGATTKAITMGAGNDTVVYGGPVGTGGSVAAGEGTDTIVMSFAEANAADASSTFNSKFTGFETLKLEDAITGALDIDGLNDVTTVTLVLGSNAGEVNNINSGGTVNVMDQGAGALTIGVDGALAGLTDSINVNILDATAWTDPTLTIANTETINLGLGDAATYASATTGAAAVVHALTLVATGATSIVVTGNNGLNLTNTGNIKVTNFDASAIIGNSTAAIAGQAKTTDSAANLAVTYTSVNTTADAAVTIKGGAGNDILTGSSDAVNVDTISGGAGDDTITGGSGADILDGGANSTTGVDTLSYADVTAATSHSLTNISGMAINMGTAAITAATIGTAMGGTVVLGGGSGVAGDALAAGSAGYLATTAANSTTTMVRDTISNFEAVVGSALADYIFAGEGKNTITAGAGADYIDLTETTAAIDTVVFTGSAAHTATTDVNNTVKGFGSADVIDFTTNTAYDGNAGAALTAFATGALGAVAATTGLQVFTDNITVANSTTGPTAAEVQTYLGATAIFETGHADDAIYLVVDNGTDAWVLELQSAGANTAFTSAEDGMVIVAKLTGLADVSTLTAANFADFA